MLWKQNNLLKFSFSQKISEKWICFALHFLYLSFSIVSPGKAFFFFPSLATFHYMHPSQVYPKFILYVHFPEMHVSLVDSMRKFFSEERTALTCHSLIIYNSKIHFLRLNINQGIGSRTGWALGKIQPKTVPSVDPDC